MAEKQKLGSAISLVVMQMAVDVWGVSAFMLVYVNIAFGFNTKHMYVWEHAAASDEAVNPRGPQGRRGS